MTTNILIGLLGVLFITITRMNGLRKDAVDANLVFSYRKYFERDWLGIVSSVLSVFIWAILFTEAAAKYPALEAFTRFSFLTMGAMGSWVLQLLLGKTKNWIRGVVDQKTNIADGKVDRP